MLKIILAALLLLPTLSWADCSAEAATLVDAINKAQKQQPTDLAWLNYGYLTNKLGVGQASAITESLLQWKNFIMLQLADGSTLSMGDPQPAGQPRPQTRQQALALLGEPIRMREASVTKYQWNCGTRVFIAFVDADGNILSFATACTTMDNCTTAAFKGIDSPLVETMKQLWNLDHPDEQGVGQQAFANVDFSPWLNFANNIQNCYPGTYLLPDPIALTKLLQANNSSAAIQQGIQAGRIKYLVKGMEGEQCLAIRSTFTHDVASGLVTEQISRCSFSKDDLNILATSARVQSQFILGKTVLDSNDPALTVLSKDCQ